jgi:hypothetical protein
MMQNAKKIKWDTMTQALPSFVTIFMVPFTFNLLRGAAFGYVTWFVMAFFSGEMFEHCKEAYLELAATWRGDIIPDRTDAGSDAHIPVIKTKQSERWYSLQALGFGDMRLPKNNFDFSTVVHSNSAMDLPSIAAENLKTMIPPQELDIRL